MTTLPFFLSGRWLFAFALSLPLAVPAASSLGTYDVYVGTYTGAKSKGIYRFAFDAATGKAGSPELAAETPSPSFLALHPGGKALYAVNEVNEFAGEKGGGLSAFAITDGGTLKPLNQASTVGAGPCHVTVDAGGKAVLVANYGGGSVVSCQLKPDGSIGLRASFVQHTGSSVNPDRQEGPHAHGIYLDARDRFAYVPDLGLDQIRIYRFAASTGTLTANDPPAGRLAPGSGPRHFAMHPRLPYAWSLNELLCTVTTFHVVAESGALHATTTASTLPGERTPGDSTAEIFVHPNGKFIYASNRGHDSITVFAIDEATGGLTTVQNQPLGARTPRNFALDPSGHWLLAAAQGSDVIKVFRIDSTTGRLAGTGENVSVPTPVCLVFRGR